MTIESADLREKLAAEYALGSLQGGARRRLEQIMAKDSALAETVTRWEMRLNPLAAALPPLPPPPWLWRRISGALSEEDWATASGLPPVPLHRRLGFWRGLWAATAAFAVALLLFIELLPLLPAPTRLAVVEDGAGHAAYVALFDPGTRRLELKNVAASPPAAGHRYELWLLPEGDGKPLSLGLLPAEGSAEMTLSRETGRLLPASAGLAVSLEPEGGSPSGQPTGPMLFKGTILSAG